MPVYEVDIIEMRYLSGALYPLVMRWEHGGIMYTPEMRNALDLNDVVWAADNGCYTAGDRFIPGKWLHFLERWSGHGHCQFAVLPDVPFNMDATIARSMPYANDVRARGYPIGLAIQNGAHPQRLPWDDIDAVFIAGDVPFKTSSVAWQVCREAKL
jgi:hypothetical protein